MAEDHIPDVRKKVPAVAGPAEPAGRHRSDGGAAFPVLPPQDTAADSAAGYPYPEAGMTLRDYFAAKALQGMLAHPECDYTPMTAQAQMQAASDAYSMADAMLAVRAA